MRYSVPVRHFYFSLSYAGHLAEPDHTGLVLRKLLLGCQEQRLGPVIFLEPAIVLGMLGWQINRTIYLCKGIYSSLEVALLVELLALLLQIWRVSIHQLVL